MKRLPILILFLAVLMLQSCYKDPIANFEYSYVDQKAPATVVFENTSTEADRFSWDFGDGATSSDKSPSHVFYNWDNPLVTLNATGRGGESSIDKTLGIRSYYVKNSTNYALYSVAAFGWDEANSAIIDRFELGNVSSGYDTESVITNNDEIYVSFEFADGTLYLVSSSYLLPDLSAYYINITGETIIEEVTGQLRTEILDSYHNFQVEAVRLR